MLVYVVIRQTGDGDGVYVFADPGAARRYASCHDTDVHTEVLIDGMLAARMLVDVDE